MKCMSSAGYISHYNTKLELHLSHPQPCSVRRGQAILKISFEERLKMEEDARVEGVES